MTTAVLIEEDRRRLNVSTALPLSLLAFPEDFGKYA